MIAEKVHDYEVLSTVTGRRIEMGIDASQAEHVMSAIIDLYSDSQKAVMREYSTNARDAHIEAGQTRPIEITLPTRLATNLIIQDWGLGLNADDIERVYSRYGTSTKRESNLFNGFLGFGCKSALAYSPQFIVIGITNGIRTTVTVSRDASGMASMMIPQEVETNEPNGVKVIIPTGPGDRFERLAAELFSYWEPGTVLVNGREPKRVEGMRISDRALIVEDAEQHVVVMGGVPYPADLPEVDLKDTHHLVVFVPIGDVHFSPSRESLRDTDRTAETLAGITAEFKRYIPTAIQAAVDKAANFPEALDTAVRMRGSTVHDYGPYHFRAVEIPKMFGGPELLNSEGKSFDPPRDENLCVVERDAYQQKAHELKRHVKASTAQGALWIYGWKSPGFTAYHKKRILAYCEMESDAAEIFILTGGKQESPFLADRQVDWQKICAVTLQRAKSHRNYTARLKGSYDVWLGTSADTRMVAADDLDASKPMFYFGSARDDRPIPATLRFLAEKAPGCTIVFVPENRRAKFLRDFPKATSGYERVRLHVRKIEKKLTKNALVAVQLQKRRRHGGSPGEIYTRLDAKRLDDPDLVKTIALASRNIKRAQERLLPLIAVRKDQRISEPDLKALGWEDPLSKYPLYDHYAELTDHTYWYMNNWYQASKEQ